MFFLYLIYKITLLFRVVES